MVSGDIFFKWSPDYSVGIKTIDDQHLVLVNTLNRLSAAVSKHEGEKVITGIFDALMSYTRIHFALEERLLLQAKYKDIDAHMEEHRKLLRQLKQLYENHLREEKPVYNETMDFLKVWLIEHIQGVDTRYSAAVKQAGFSVSSWEREASAEFNRASKALSR